MISLPPLRVAEGPDRFPPIDPSMWTAKMRVAAEALVAGPRGEVRGPFVPLMRSPELLDKAQKLGAVLRYDSVIDPRLREFATCVIARHWSQPYEWSAHAKLAAEAGVALATLASLRDGEAHPDMADDERQVLAVCTKLLTNQHLDDDAFHMAAQLLGEQALIELAALCGYYSLLAIVMNLARTPYSGEAFALPV